MRAPERVVVITGASSGIGRATAHAFAREGARLVLAARAAKPLDDVVAECELLGAQAIAVPTDVSVEEQVERLVAAAVERFGRVDVWVGAASVYIYGTVQATPTRSFERLFEVNLMGQIHGVRAVLPAMEKGAVVVLLGSVYSLIATPYVSAYIASKHGLLGFAKALRQEVRQRGIRVSVVMPATIDTPIYQHAANYTGYEVRPLPPYVDPMRVARAVVRIARRPRATIIVGVVQRLAILADRLLGPVNDRLAIWAMNRVAVLNRSTALHDGNLFEPMPEENVVDGGWRSKDPRSGT